MTARWPLWAVLAATLLATGWLASQEDDDAPVATARREPAVAASTVPTGARAATDGARTPAPAPGPSPTWPAPPTARSAAAWGFDPAQARTWVPPPAPAPPATVRATVIAAAAPASQPPQAPPFPYQLIGRVEDAGVAHALLAAPGRTIGARASDVLDGQWRVEDVGSQGLAVTWLPGGQRVQVPFRPS